MIKAKVSADYKDIERIFAGGAIQKEIIKVWSTEANDYVFEAWKVLEMDGPLPLTFTANGEPLIDYRIYGNTEQTGTPTPENPIMPIGCGERTENLFDEEYGTITTSIGYLPIYVGSGDFTLSTTAPLVNDTSPLLFLLSGNTSSGASPYNNAYAGNPRTQTSIDGYVTVAYRRVGSYKPNMYQTMLTAGSTAPTSYIPYGYKLPILSNSTVTNIYLGEVQTTRRIKKLVLTGEENFVMSNNCFVLWLNSKEYPFPKQEVIYCTHYKGQTPTYQDSLGNCQCMITVNQNQAAIKDSSYATATDFKSYLAAQYAAGTPVTVWYVLAEPETAVVNEPLMKIVDYADTVDGAQTNVQIPTIAGTNVIDYDGGEKRFVTSDGYELVDKNQNGFLLSGSTDSTLCPEKMYIKYKGR